MLIACAIALFYKGVTVHCAAKPEMVGDEHRKAFFYYTITTSSQMPDRDNPGGIFSQEKLGFCSLKIVSKGVGPWLYR